MKKNFLVGVLAVVVLLSASCLKENSAAISEDNKASIVGVWRIEKEVFEVLFNGEIVDTQIDYPSDDFDEYYYEFKPNGTVVGALIETPTSTEYCIGTYAITGKDLFMEVSYSESAKKSINRIIESITYSSLVLLEESAELKSSSFPEELVSRRRRYVFNKVQSLPLSPISGESESSDTPKAVDLGLSVKWGSCNIGATRSEEYGYFYAWGETQTKADYTWYTYVFGNRASRPFSKYDVDTFYGVGDKKYILDPEDDIAHVALGSSWRMPTIEEWTELKTKCAWSWTDNYNGTGVNGAIVKASNGNSIFLPAAGFATDDDNSRGYYWSSSLYTDDAEKAWYLYIFADDVCGISRSPRYYGHSVRPVSD